MKLIRCMAKFKCLKPYLLRITVKVSKSLQRCYIQSTVDISIRKAIPFETGWLLQIVTGTYYTTLKSTL